MVLVARRRHSDATGTRPRGRRRLQPGCTPRLGNAAFTVCPTECVGTRPSPYLSELGEGMPPEDRHHVDRPHGVLTALSTPAIRADGPTRSAVDGVLVWDNYPVNDRADRRGSLHLGPYTGTATRDWCEVVGGVLCNPMTQAHASLSCRSRPRWNSARLPIPRRAEDSWSAAIADVGADHAEAFAVFGRACARQPHRRARRPRLHPAASTSSRTSSTVPAGSPRSAAVADELRATRTLTDSFPAGDDSLSNELAPWAFGARVEAEAGLAALRLIQQSRPVATPR